MPNELLLLEKINITESLETPHLSYIDDSLVERKKVAYSILSRTTGDILLLHNSGFRIDSVFAGLTGKHIEHIAKNAPKKYKESLLKSIQDVEMLSSALEIAKDMDEDLSEKENKNQERVKNIIQYIKDNRAVFEF
jgi:hypothetical protein